MCITHHDPSSPRRPMAPCPGSLRPCLQVNLSGFDAGLLRPSSHPCLFPMLPQTAPIYLYILDPNLGQPQLFSIDCSFSPPGPKCSPSALRDAVPYANADAENLANQ
ncbi:hypothetical protein VDGL01_07717 [Verticillium dahliae]